MLRSPSHGYFSDGRPLRTYIDHLADDTGYPLNEFLTAMKNLSKSEEQLIVNPKVWINTEKKPSSEDQALEKEVWIKM